MKIIAEFQNQSKKPKKLYPIINDISFWNREGERIYRENRLKTLGNEFSQKQAEKLSMQAFVMDCIFHELKIILPEFFIYRGGSHISIHDDKNTERIVILTINN